MQMGLLPDGQISLEYGQDFGSMHKRRFQRFGSSQLVNFSIGASSERKHIHITRTLDRFNQLLQVIIKVTGMMNLFKHTVNFMLLSYF
jgi:hypothetical protein